MSVKKLQESIIIFWEIFLWVFASKNIEEVVIKVINENMSI